MKLSRFLRPLTELACCFFLYLRSLHYSQAFPFAALTVSCISTVWCNWMRCGATAFFLRAGCPISRMAMGCRSLMYYAPLVSTISPHHCITSAFRFPSRSICRSRSPCSSALSAHFILPARCLGIFFQDKKQTTLGAFISAVAFLYAPYILFNSIHRANLAEQWALAFAPFALWRFYCTRF